MEFGNILFGNSRGNYKISRGVGWEDELIRLFDAVKPNRDNSWREYGFHFENDTFMIFPYYWGECTCGWQEKIVEWEMENNHRKDCIHHDVQKINHYSIWKNHKDWEEKYLKPIYEKHGLDTKGKNWWHGCAVKCNCGKKERWAEFVKKGGHDEDCPIVRPNFLHKPTGFEIQWYKYPLRDSYKNMELSLDEFREVIDDCIESLR